MTPATASSWSQALRVYTHPRVLGMLSLGFSAGLPLLLIMGTLSFWLREAGITPESWLKDPRPSPQLSSVIARLCATPGRRRGGRRGWRGTTQS